MTAMLEVPPTRRQGKRARGFFGVAVWHPKTEVNVGSLWRSAWLFDAAFIATIGKRYQKQSSDTPGVANHVPLQHYADLDDLIDHLPNSCPLVGVELDDRAYPLHNYVHPPQALYLLGAEDHGLPGKVLDRCHQLVQIPTARPYSMNVSVAGSIVMNDRYAKAGVR